MGVFLGYASSRGRALIGCRLYRRNHAWCQDAERHRHADVPNDVVLAAEPHLPLQMIASAFDTGVSTS